MASFNTIVIGAGPGGLEAARVLAEHGESVALVEARAVGGTCVNRGCMPAKTMLYSAHMYRQLELMEEYGVKIPLQNVEIDYETIVKKRQQIINSQQEQILADLKAKNVELFPEFATMQADQTIKLSNGDVLTADNIVLATGGAARKFPGFQEDNPFFLTSDDIFSLEEIPDSLVIVGGGPVGTEFASFYNTMGTEVTIIDIADNFLIHYEQRLGEALIAKFRQQGINVITGSHIKETADVNDQIRVTLANGTELHTDYILSAIGVAVNTDYLGAMAFAKDKAGRLTVDEHFQTNHAGIFAVGDLIGKSGSAYGAEREARAVAHQILDLDANLAPVNYNNMPDVVFTYPEVATCGLSSQQLAELGRPYSTIYGSYGINAKAQILQETTGKVWLYFAEGSERLLGVHIIGAQATEVIHQVPAWLQANYAKSDILKLVWGHPVLAEVLRDVLLHGETIENLG